MFGLTPLGAIHTAISLVALAAGLLAMIRHREILPATGLGRLYIWATVLTCLTGFGIFQHGGFGKPHALGILTLVVLGVAALAGPKKRSFGRASPYIETVGYSATFFFHMIPGLTETFTRLPLGAPLFSGPEDPALQKLVGLFFLVLVVGAALQVRRLRRQRADVPTASTQGVGP
jgi:uncharacterized membrane protein